MRVLSVFAFIVLAGPSIIGLSAQANAAAAWRQWGGPNRNFIVNTTGLAEKWPETGPPAAASS